ncbi:hypothetical protein [Actinoplanes regularis]|uniref:hypothetical protein n=1 Tax=Actinoplanes regularis TaxID=52697 RepID=UPI0024A407E9|nr:hypothetical protein [Actinoplanes regularis]GLW34664.1 hypothetical protein Areg01_76010 [Actinoplanes regularis]
MVRAHAGELAGTGWSYGAAAARDLITERMLLHGGAEPEPGGLLRPDPGLPGPGLEFRDEVASRFRAA